ncbi:MAG: radical SAM family heme chaperone HemW [Candidatus Izemoplasma sp.]
MLTALYIHIPFCDHICTYCDFHKEIAKESKKESYINSLIKELAFHGDSYQGIRTIYLGGGTPSSLDLTILEKLFINLKKHINLDKVIEFTMECNPNDVDQSLIDLLIQYQVSRVSLGVQTFNQSHLDFLGRTHDKVDVLNAIDLLNINNLTNISIDLMFALTNQTLKDLKEDIAEALKLDIKHISYYSLILEEKTKLYQLYRQKKISLIEEDLEGLMYNIVIDSLTENGYNHYEISNFSKAGYESLHNKIYWQNKDYLGIGASAHSLIGNERFYNIGNTTLYINTANEDLTKIKTSYLREDLREELMMGLRLLKGINVPEVNEKFSIDLFEKYPELHKFIKQNILEYKNDQLLFTRSGLLLGNIVFQIF